MVNLPWRDAAIKILNESNDAMHYAEIARNIVEKGLRTSVGATPANSVNYAINKSINEDKEATPFIKVGDGAYFLRSKIVENKSGLKSKNTIKNQNQENYNIGPNENKEIIQAFGMFWERDLVLWKGSPNIFGRQQIGASPVNFGDQLGVYLLYDGRDVVYVGRSIDRPLGRRLFEHTQDRLKGRWDRFSWFGLLAVKDNGMLDRIQINPTFDTIIATLEALLIEGLEPPQNRKRGDEFNAIEYLQAEDGEIAKQQMQNFLIEISNKFAK